ncbi:MAG: hypothetical protein COV48_06925, partial [Elusimicrobia bacterium CG11_big_fil_rev_8_21_14_0_20_64_6]
AKIGPGLKLLAGIIKRGSDVGRRCELTLKYWAQAHLSALDDESSFLNLWAIVDIINPKAGNGDKLAHIMPVYWLQQKFPQETSAVLEEEYQRVKDWFETLWSIRSRGVIHRQQASWEPRALAIWTAILRDYLSVALGGFFHHLLNCKTCRRGSVDILSVIRCMLDRARAVGLPAAKCVEVQKKLR